MRGATRQWVQVLNWCKLSAENDTLNYKWEKGKERLRAITECELSSSAGMIAAVLLKHLMQVLYIPQPIMERSQCPMAYWAWPYDTVRPSRFTRGTTQVRSFDPSPVVRPGLTRRGTLGALHNCLWDIRHLQRVLEQRSNNEQPALDDSLAAHT